MMPTLKAAVLGTISFPIIVLAALALGVIVVAIYKKDHVRAVVWLRSCGFSLEAGDRGPKK